MGIGCSEMHYMMALLGVGLAGTMIFLLCLDHHVWSGSSAAGRPYAALKTALTMFIKMKLTCFCSLSQTPTDYTGQLTFWLGVNWQSIAYTQVKVVHF